VKATHERGILTGGHIILGLPLTHTIPNYLQQETENISKLPLDTLKIHQLQLIKGTKMAEEYVNHPEHFHLYQSFEYIDEVIDFLELIRPELIVERFVSQSPSSLLAIPGWGLKNYEFVEKVNKRLEERDTYQGRLYHIT
ncbi:MAG: TIGR01212 family radical SAM protein, partial [Bacteroidaceae bacterium]|nr:TIGR01212 family radical SAM protein [Bacteroidaceae bacterium]